MDDVTLPAKITGAIVVRRPDVRWSQLTWHGYVTVSSPALIDQLSYGTANGCCFHEHCPISPHGPSPAVRRAAVFRTAATVTKCILWYAHILKRSV